MKNLQLPLIGKWFEMTKAGIKSEDYREITPYWAKRLLNHTGFSLQDSLTENQIVQLCKEMSECTGIDEFNEGSDIDYQIDNWYVTFKPFTQNTMTLGYPKSTDTERIIKFEHKGIEIRTGNPEWGAQEGKLYFVIKHGNPINNL